MVKLAWKKSNLLSLFNSPPPFLPLVKKSSLHLSLGKKLKPSLPYLFPFLFPPFSLPFTSSFPSPFPFPSSQLIYFPKSSLPSLYPFLVFPFFPFPFFPFPFFPSLLPFPFTLPFFLFLPLPFFPT